MKERKLPLLVLSSSTTSSEEEQETSSSTLEEEGGGEEASGEEASGEEGGGLWNSATGSLSISDTTIADNIASGAGADQMRERRPHPLKVGDLGVDLVLDLVSPPVRRLLGLISVSVCIAFSFLMLKGAWDSAIWRKVVW